MSAETLFRLNQLAGLLGAYAYRYASEVQLHERIAEILAGEGIEFTREHPLDAKNRADFWIDGIVVEVKVDGTMGPALRQCSRYLALPEVAGVLLVATPSWSRERIKLLPKYAQRLKMVSLRRQAL